VSFIRWFDAPESRINSASLDFELEIGFLNMKAKLPSACAVAAVVI